MAHAPAPEATADEGRNPRLGRDVRAGGRGRAGGARRGRQVAGREPGRAGRGAQGAAQDGRGPPPDDARHLGFRPLLPRPHARRRSHRRGETSSALERVSDDCCGSVRSVSAGTRRWSSSLAWARSTAWARVHGSWPAAVAPTCREGRWRRRRALVGARTAIGAFDLIPVAGLVGDAIAALFRGHRRAAKLLVTHIDRTHYVEGPRTPEDGAHGRSGKGEARAATNGLPGVKPSAPPPRSAWREDPPRSRTGSLRGRSSGRVTGPAVRARGRRKGGPERWTRRPALTSLHASPRRPRAPGSPRPGRRAWAG